LTPTGIHSRWSRLTCSRCEQSAWCDPAKPETVETLGAWVCAACLKNPDRCKTCSICLEERLTTDMPCASVHDRRVRSQACQLVVNGHVCPGCLETHCEIKVAAGCYDIGCPVCNAGHYEERYLKRLVPKVTAEITRLRLDDREQRLAGFFEAEPGPPCET
jgi:hypothetical protein